MTDKSCLTAFMCFKAESSKILFHSFQPCDLHTLFVKFFMDINRPSSNGFITFDFIPEPEFPFFPVFSSFFLNGKSLSKAARIP